MKDRKSINRFRFLRVAWFFFWAFAHIFFFDILLNRPGLSWLRPDSKGRYRRIARRFRRMAIALGGVLIKLGQFLSIRVDVLPREITSELADLQDKVPPAPAEAVRKIVAESLGRPLDELFEDFEDKPIGAASLAQVHRVRLKNGRPLVIKVLRPGIETLVETDLAAVAMACGWLKWYKAVAARVNLDWLVEEFTAVTRAELDFAAEATNLERFRTFFKDEPRLYLPKLYPDYSKGRVLAMENVAWFKPEDGQAMSRAGIDVGKAARTFFDLHMQQVFHQHVVHADPHPGNLFIRPLLTPEEVAENHPPYLPGEAVGDADTRDFQVVLVDFGMIGFIPDRLRHALREYAIGLATRDPHRMVQSYVKAGTLLPNADLARIEELHEVLLDNIWGVANNRMQKAAAEVAPKIFDDFREVLFNTPFQVQVDLLFTVRSVEVMNGLVTRLDPNFNPWQALLPFAKELASDNLDAGKMLEKLADNLRALARLPGRADRLLAQAERGALVVRYGLTPELRGRLKTLQRSLDNLGSSLLAVGLLLAGVLLYIHKGEGYLDELLLGGALLTWLKTFFR